MPSPRFEVPSGTIDGVNTVFTVSRPYRAGSTAVFLNGALQERNLDDGWLETDPTAGTVTLKEAPRSVGVCPDVVQVFFIDTSPSLPETEVTKIRGRIRQQRVLRGRFSDAVPLSGQLRVAGSLTGQIRLLTPIIGSVRCPQRIKAVIRESCL